MDYVFSNKHFFQMFSQISDKAHPTDSFKPVILVRHTAVITCLIILVKTFLYLIFNVLCE
jgi:hypothetical protein